LKNALLQSAQAAPRHDPLSKAYYDWKRAEGKRHNAAVMRPARRRLNVLFVMAKHRALLREEDPPA
jgi:hypothetical protein